MSNPWGRMGAPMIQPTKGELREIISDLQRANSELRIKLLAELTSHGLTKRKLETATRMVGELVDQSGVSRRSLFRLNQNPEPQPEQVTRRKVVA